MIFLVLEIIRDAEREAISVEHTAGILFARSCVIRGSLYSKGPIIALGSLKADKVISDVFIAIGGTLSAKNLISARLILAQDIECKGWIITPTLRFFSCRSIANSWMTYGELATVFAWNKIICAAICAAEVKSGEEIKTLKGPIVARRRIESGNIISAGDIIVGWGYPDDKSIIPTIEVSGYIESEGDIYSEYDIIAGKYIKAHGRVEAGRRILAGKEHDGEIIAREVVGEIKRGIWKKP